MPTEAAIRPLGGRTGWLITDGKIGMRVQVQGVAEALGLAWEHKCVTPGWLGGLIAPFGPPLGGVFGPPWPDVAIATGRQSIPALRAIRRKTGRATFTVVIQDPRTGTGTADLIAVPAHDRLDGENVIRTLTAPHPFSPTRLAALRAAMPNEIATLPGPRVALVLGGPNAIYRFEPPTIKRLARSLESLARADVSFLVTPSRRTPEPLAAAVRRAIAGRPQIVWEGNGQNPYPEFLAHADAFVVTADSVNITGEACATGRPVYVFEPDGGSPKFARFHQGLRDYGATRLLPPDMARLEHWSYAPLHAAEIIAAEIERRWRPR